VLTIWKNLATLDALNALSKGTAIESMGIVFTEIGDETLRAEMPVDGRTRQPFGVLHGGASVVLAETLGSTASYLSIEPGWESLGIDINANHLLAVREGKVTGTVRPIRLGKSIQVWAIEIHDAAGALVCVARLTTTVRPSKARPT
jgi:uncharacterized protein (TIGR00369 family)